MFKSKIISQLFITLAIFFFTFPNISDAEIKVYDKNNQYLGVLLNIETGGSMTVFIPSLSASYTFLQAYLLNPDLCPIDQRLFFESDDCTGTPYIWGIFPAVFDFNCQPYAGHYLPDFNSKAQFVPKSYSGGDGTGNLVCNEYVQPAFGNDLLYEAKQVQLPFKTPIALPVRFENVSNTPDFFVIPIEKK
jgi:hypothetical protein